MDRGAKEDGVKRIRIHDIRHSAVSLLIDMGFSATAIHKANHRLQRDNDDLFAENMELRNKLEDYLADINRRAEVIFLQVVRQLSEKEEVTEKMKAESQMEWVGRMNNIRARAREIVNGEIVNI